MTTQGTWYDRSDPAAFDYTVGDFTTDGNWNDLDLSSILPEGAEIANIYIVLQDDAVGSYFQVQKKGYSNAINAPRIRTQVANAYTDGILTVSCDANRTIQYRTSNTTFSGIFFVVIGWYIPVTVQDITDLTTNTTPALEDVIYSIDDPNGTPADRKVSLKDTMKLAPHWEFRQDVAPADWAVGDLTTDGTYYDLDCSGIVPEGAAAILFKVIVKHASLINIYFQLRKNGYSDLGMSVRPQVVNQNNDGQMIIPCDKNRIVEYFASNTTWATLSIWVMGWYIDDGVNVTTTTTSSTTTTTTTA